jgi:hypothetical protein
MEITNNEVKGVKTKTNGRKRHRYNVHENDDRAKIYFVLRNYCVKD